MKKLLPLLLVILLLSDFLELVNGQQNGKGSKGPKGGKNGKGGQKGPKGPKGTKGPKGKTSPNPGPSTTETPLPDVRTKFHVGIHYLLILCTYYWIFSSFLQHEFNVLISSVSFITILVTLWQAYICLVICL